MRGPELFTVWFFVLAFAGQAALTWVAYLVLEPYARAHWPQTLVSWNRLLQGRFRDPMVGRDALIGALFGVVLILLFYVDGKEFSAFGTSGLLGPRHAVAVVPHAASAALSITLALFLALISLQRIFRRRAVAVAISLGFVPFGLVIVAGMALGGSRLATAPQRVRPGG